MYSATITDSSGNPHAYIYASDSHSVVSWMQEQKKVHQMRDKRPIFFRKLHTPIFKNKQWFTMTCDFLLTKRI